MALLVNKYYYHHEVLAHFICENKEVATIFLC
jgi:hypothetical protein